MATVYKSPSGEKSGLESRILLVFLCFVLAFFFWTPGAYSQETPSPVTQVTCHRHFPLHISCWQFFFFLHARTLYYIMDIYMFYLVNHFNSSLDWVMEEEMYTQSLKNHSFHMLFFSAVEERIAERLRDISWSFEKVSVWFFSRMFWWFYILPHITLEYLVHMLSRFFLKILRITYFLRNHHYLCVWPEGNIGVC